MDRDNIETEPAVPSGGAPMSRPRTLAVLHTPDVDLRDRTIPIGERVSIGRKGGADVDVEIGDRLLSRLHATIECGPQGQTYFINDHDSRNGSFVDGKRIKGRRRLRDGAIVRLGVSVFELSCEHDLDEITSAEVGDDDERLVGRSEAFRRVITDIERVADSDEPLLIIGEMGTGKSMVARRLHHVAKRGGSMVSVKCGGLPPGLAAASLFGRAEGTPPLPDERRDLDGKGLFHAARGGTLLLDELEQLDREVQKLLLSALDTGEYTPLGADNPVAVDTRVVAASSANLEATVDYGDFDQKLYDVFAVNALELPSLRSRRCDVPVLLKHFLSLAAPGRSFDWSPTCLEKMLLYDWPMNIAELRGVVERFALLDDDVSTLRSAHLPKEIRRRYRQITEDALRASAISVQSAPSREELRALLKKFGGDVSFLARYYAKDRLHVNKWLSRHDLEASDYEAD